jgi:hypothetical protein
VSCVARLHPIQEITMPERHTEQDLHHSRDEQNTGNHPKPGTPEEHGADRFGGTRKGAENIEENSPQKSGQQ